MKILELKNIEKFVVISDVHLREPEADLTKLFIDTISSFKNMDALFLLGDIFDFIAVESEFFFDYWRNVFQVFRNLKESGVQVYFIEGNHDFGFEHFKSSFLNNCFTNYGDFNIQLLHTKLGLMHLTHGDNVVRKPSYIRFRNLVKSRRFQAFTAKLFSGKIMQFIFSRYAKISRKRDEYRSLPDDFLNECINEVIDEFPQMTVLIMGHIHILKDCIVRNGVRFLVGQDWLTKPSYLVYSHENGFERVYG